MEKKYIAINEHGIYLLFRGPFPQAIVDIADQRKYFSDRRSMLIWLDAEWPDWQDNLVESKGLV